MYMYVGYIHISISKLLLFCCRSCNSVSGEFVTRCVRTAPAAPAEAVESLVEALQKFFEVGWTIH